MEQSPIWNSLKRSVSRHRPAHDAVKQLEERGIIKGQVTLLDASKLGLKLIALIQISMDRHTPDRFEDLRGEGAHLSRSHRMPIDYWPVG